MNRVALDLGFFQIYWYSLFILFGIFTALFVIYKELKREQLDVDKFFDMAIYAIIIGILGARIYYVLFNLNYYSTNIVEIFQIWNGGLAIHGGILFGGLFILYYTKKYKLDTLKFLDIIVVGLIIAQAIGRWGNFFNNEAYGVETTLTSLRNMHLPEFIIDGMHINNHYYTPTFLYESLWNVLGFIILLIVRKNKNLKIGVLSGIYLTWYSLGRFFIEGLRLDSLMFMNIRVAQLVSLLLFIIGIILTIISIRRNKNYHIEGE